MELLLFRVLKEDEDERWPGGVGLLILAHGAALQAHSSSRQLYTQRLTSLWHKIFILNQLVSNYYLCVIVVPQEYLGMVVTLNNEHPVTSYRQ